MENYWVERGKSGAIRARLTANAERIYSSLSRSLPYVYSRVLLSVSPGAPALPSLLAAPLAFGAPLSLSRAAHRKSLPRRQLSAGDTADWLRRKRRYLCCWKSRSLGDGFNTLGMNNLTPLADWASRANTFRRIPDPLKFYFGRHGRVRAVVCFFLLFSVLFSFPEYSALTFLRIRRLGECYGPFSTSTFCPGV